MIQKQTLIIYYENVDKRSAFVSILIHNNILFFQYYHARPNFNEHIVKKKEIK